MTDQAKELILWFESERATDVGRVGGKNASLAEMTRALVPAGVRVPGGFAVTSEAYWAFVDDNQLRKPIADELAALAAGKTTLQKAGAAIRRMVRAADIPHALREAITAAYRELCRREGLEHAPVAVRSSATAEDLPTASFAGQQESYLNISGETEVLTAYRLSLIHIF